MPRLKSKKLYDVHEGQYRIFYNFYRGKDRLTLGFPKNAAVCHDVYIQVNGTEQDRFSIPKAMGILKKSGVFMPYDEYKRLV